MASPWVAGSSWPWPAICGGPTPAPSSAFPNASGDSLGVRAAYRVGLVGRIFEGRDFAGQVSTAIETFRARDATDLRALKAGPRESADAWTPWHTAEAAALEALWLRRTEAR